MGYGIGLAGLNSTAQAIDVVSNDIANAQTVGFKSAQFVFADMYFQANDAQAKDRVGMGSQQQAIRRDQSYGTLQTTQNPLDLAITGPGMFMLAKNVIGTVPTESPSKFEYTRNGQFGTDSQNRIVNQSGLLLVGYPADTAGNIIAGAKSTMILDPQPLPSQPTINSKLDLNLDTRNPAMDIRFDPTNSITYSQATSQTIYDQNGNGHILSLFYKRISSQPLNLTLGLDGAYSYNPTQQLEAPVSGTPAASFDATTQRPKNEQMSVIASTYKGEDSKYTVATTGATAGVKTLTVGSANTEKVSVVGAQKTLTGGTLGAVGSTYDLRLADGTHIPIKQTVAYVAPQPAPANPVVAEVLEVFQATTDRFEVYSTIDGNKVGHNPDANKDGDVSFRKASDGALNTQQMSIGTMAFLGGVNIDTLATGADGKPANFAASSFKLNALSASPSAAYGRTNQNGIMQFTIESNISTALTAPTQTYANSQDGHTVSNLSGYSIDGSGKLIATYDNGVQAVKGQLILAQFKNLDGLMPNGSNTFAATSASGDPILSAPGTGLLGQVRSKSLEASNVDLTAELVQLMVLQRQYSATSQALKLQAATIVDDAINMSR
ncbi:flagellar hook-basal body complex protein [Polynucleobacter sp. AP-Sving-400A-A2]|uniref:flagellar hook-basal body complex protein n=1 Tax=Polynucleobacter sp. AP-Sving-400A-A2 TaxID=2081049 RepID=UPI001BFD406A|nr:flagellar hook-basal body complex protein [Polynucleobacter sp. AP-Sving-400A-A2]QWE14992.1 flagellar hook-basal body complex protein [Polynucleobacter sp. AP-Sving-400A-A2]